MRRDRRPDKSLPPVDKVSESQIRATQAQIRERSGTMPDLDLHAMSAQEAAVEIQSFLSRCHVDDEVSCLIHHGKGTGILAKVVKQEIQKATSQGIVEQSLPSEKYPGGAVLVVFNP